MATQSASPPMREGDHPFSDASVVFAIDRSGSTHGIPLLRELAFIAKVCQILTPESRSRVKVVPWDHTVDSVLDLEHVGSISARGGTDPSAILRHRNACTTVSASSVWFLMTDGLIGAREQERFANLVPQAGVHGIACIPVVFGRTSHPVSQCNVSVGVSLFSICPDSAFLYSDVTTDELIIMQTKGVFNTLLKGAENPIIADDATPWHSFPRMAVSALSDILVPAPKKLGADQVALQEGLVVNFEDLWANRLDRKQVDRIFGNEDNMNTITMSAQSKGAKTTAQFQSWVQMQQIQVQEPLTRPRPDQGNLARGATAELSRLMREGRPLSDDLKRRLRRAHVANMQAFLGSCNQEVELANMRQQRISQHYAKSRTPILRANALSSGHKRPLATNTVIPSPGEPSQKRPAYGGLSNGPSASGLSTVSPEDSWESLGMSRLDSQLQNLLYTPGFRCSQGSFKGECSVCGLRDATLAWLFKGPVPATIPRNMDFPLSIGALPDTAGIMSSRICCEACSTYFIDTTRPLGSETMVAALPMVCYTENTTAYNRTLSNIFPGGSAENLQAFISILLNSARGLSGTESLDLFHRAVKWTCSDIAGTIHVGGAPLAHAFEKATNVESPILRYPLPGFIVILRASTYVTAVTPEARRMAAFRRYLFSLTESVTAFLAKAAREKTTTEATQLIYSHLWEEDEDPDMVVVSASAGQQQPSPPDTHPRKDTQTRRLTLPMASLRGTPFLSDSDYLVLQEADEFRAVAAHGGCAAAAFLHALMDVVEKHNYDSALDLFKLVMSRKELAPIFAEPESVNVDGVVGMLKALSL